jgi:hypothetical protein
MALLNDLPVKQADIDVTICVYHHPDNWLEPNFRRDFRRFVESRAHIVFTGHEHQQDSHWVEANGGDLVQRHTQIIPLQRETLRKIAGELRVNSVQLLRNAGHPPRK